MQKNLSFFLALFIFLGVIIAGCGTQLAGPAVSASSVSDETPPSVVSNNPGNNNTGVHVNTPITVTFNEAVDAATIDSTTFSLSGGVTGTVSYDSGSKTATFTPSVTLAYDTTYTVTVTTGVKDPAGNAIASPYSWSFTTGSVPDTTAPTVQTHNPGNGETGVAVNSAITVTFSEPIDGASIGVSSFMLSGDVVGTVSYDTGSRTASFNPSSSLAYDTTYTATITTGVKDLSGNVLASAYTWTFTTGSAPDTTAPTVQSHNPDISASGVAINSAITVTFSEPMKIASINNTTFTISGGVSGTVNYDLGSRTATFNPTSDLAYDTTYTATITTGVKDISENSLASTYSWTFTTGPAPDTTAPTVQTHNPDIAETGVAVNSAITVTFSEPMKISSIDNTTFTLSGGVSGSVIYDSGSRTATFNPAADLTYGTTYTATITTGVKDLSGNALAATFTWTFTTGSAPDTDTTAPFVQSVTPADGAAGAAVNSAITVTFSEPMDASTIGADSFLVNDNVAGTINYDAGSRTATFNPTGNLAYDTTYTVIITTGVKDISGIALVSPKVWTFTTGSAPDTTPPVIQANNPVNGASGAAVNSAITVTFNEAMDASTIGAASFLLSGGVYGTIIYNNISRTATFNPAGNLAYDTTYTVTITIGVKDLSGNAMASAFSWTFTTGSAPDTTPPTVQTVSPVNGAVDVQINPVITAVFNEDMDIASINPTTILLNDSLVKDITYDTISKTVSFKPAAILAFNTAYTTTITTGVKDLSGNVMTTPYSWTFTTVSGQTLVPMDDLTKEKIKEAIKTKKFLDLTKYKDILFDLPTSHGVSGEIDSNINIDVSGEMTLDGTMAYAEVRNNASGLVKVDTTDKPINLSTLTKVNAQKETGENLRVTGASVTEITTTDNQTPEFLINDVKILLKEGNSMKWEVNSPTKVFDLTELPFLNKNTRISIEVIINSSIAAKVYLYHEGKMDVLTEKGNTPEGNTIYSKEYMIGNKTGTYIGFAEVISKESLNSSQKFQARTWVVGYTVQ